MTFERRLSWYHPNNGFIDTEEEQVNLRRISLTSTGNGRLTGKVEVLPMLPSARFKG